MKKIMELAHLGDAYFGSNFPLNGLIKNDSINLYSLI